MNTLAKNVLKLIGLVAIAAAILGGVFYWDQLRGVWPAISKPSGDIAEILDKNNNNPPKPGENNTDFPLKLPDGFKIEVLAKNLPGARVMAFDQLGNMWVSQTSQGKVSLIEFKDGKILSQSEVFRGLKNPHGLAFDPENGLKLFVAEENKVSSVSTYTEDVLHKLVDLPSGGGHFTRTIDFGPDNKLYVSIGSSCNVCDESDQRRASIYTMDRDGSNFKQFARGLRNSVFMAWSYVDGSMWATENSRDLLGDNVPPDEINVIKEGQNYGWPTCYGNNTHDEEFDKKVYIRNPCSLPYESPAKVDLQAHSAPLGLAFIPEEGWPEEYWYDLIVAYHGSWNRTQPTGYKLVRIKLDDKGNYEGTEDFITGWLQKDGALGRPVDVHVSPGGLMYVSDDKAGVIYKITYQVEQ
jgi:glucose/arabinose dehydrogenase